VKEGRKEGRKGGRKEGREGGRKERVLPFLNEKKEGRKEW
jgi:hypothetical protein